VIEEGIEHFGLNGEYIWCLSLVEPMSDELLKERFGWRVGKVRVERDGSFGRHCCIVVVVDGEILGILVIVLVVEEGASWSWGHRSKERRKESHGMVIHVMGFPHHVVYYHTSYLVSYGMGAAAPVIGGAWSL
jgi:hypothetical protein